ncbi:MAG TPA: 2-phospho-L-lactate guanylyltransferase [Armatimonadota bacterium]|jgi:2-phospho-L-lactate guanylyltransferase
MAQRTQYRVLIPQKDLAGAKTRLRAVLSAADRHYLTLALLRRTLEVCAQLPASGGLLVSGPSELAELVASVGATLLPGGRAGMRRDITEAARVAASGDHALLIVSGDMPLVNLPDLERVLAEWRAGREVVLVPDHRRRGTNVMLVDRPEAFPYAFGGALLGGSFEAHFNTAEGLDLSVAVVESPALALDLDLPADLARFLLQAPDDPLAQFCRERAREKFLPDTPRD